MRKVQVVLCLSLMALSSSTYADAFMDLWAAAKMGDLSRVNALLASGVSPNGWKNGFRIEYTPLTIAVTEGHAEVVTALLRSGAEVNAVNKKGPPALFWAAFHCRPEIARLLIDAGADVNLGDFQNRQPPIYIAAAFDCDKVLSQLIVAKADINRRTEDGTTALMTAAARNHPLPAKILIQAGADLSLVDKANRTALAWAQAAKSETVVSLLVEHGAATTPSQGEGQQAVYAGKDMALELGQPCPSSLDVFGFVGRGQPFSALARLKDVIVLLEPEQGRSMAKSALELLHSQCVTTRDMPEVVVLITAPGFELPARPAGIVISRHGLQSALATGRSEDFRFLNFALAAKRREEFAERNNIFDMPGLDALMANPFPFRGKIVGLALKFVTMETESKGRFSSPTEEDGEEEEKEEKGEIIVTGLPPSLFTARGSLVYLAGKVEGKTSLPGFERSFTELGFVDAYFCQEEACEDITATPPKAGQE